MTEEQVAANGEAVPTAQELLGTFMADTMASMSDWERAQLPIFAGDEVNQCVAKTVKAVEFQDDASARARLHNLVAGLNAVETEQRFVYDPINDGAIGVGPEDELVTFQRARLTTVPQADGLPNRTSITGYDAVVPLTGPRKGEQIAPQDYAHMTTFRS
jgi:hypothetical protein